MTGAGHVRYVSTQYKMRMCYGVTRSDGVEVRVRTESILVGCVVESTDSTRAVVDLYHKRNMPSSSSGRESDGATACAGGRLRV